MGGSDGYESIQSQYDWSYIAPSEAVIDAIACLEDVESVALSVQLDTTLYDHIDPESLDTLVTGCSTLSISFIVDEYKIQINGNTLIISCD
ncbi:HalOD1 output domain-containing protein [Natronorubrum halophilum]|uniref:HalOD1 output domain-containing protein n=1 Tax=Natronorubrum halophilum TaxID=1702106 RepID=UPI000EF73EBF|nr:HalOD1 output domain-containing protein [Natronorubrum halophilum]